MQEKEINFSIYWIEEKKGLLVDGYIVPNYKFIKYIYEV